MTPYKCFIFGLCREFALYKCKSQVITSFPLNYSKDSYNALISSTEVSLPDFYSFEGKRNAINV